MLTQPPLRIPPSGAECRKPLAALRQSADITRLMRTNIQAVYYGIVCFDSADLRCRADHFNGNNLLYCKVLWCKG